MLEPNANPHEHPFLFNSGADQTRSDNNYGTWGAMNYASRAQKTAQNYANYRSWNSMGARINDSKPTGDEEDDSGVCSPPLWKTTVRANNYRNLSPASRTQAIARGQKELMEMVKNMPESCYELSLKDLVEHNNKPMVDEEEDQEDEEDKSTENLVRWGNETRDGNYKKKKSEKKKMVMRSKSIDSGGFLLKMVFPISFGSNKKNMNRINSNKEKKMKSDCVVVGGNSNNSTTAKVSPKPQGVDGSGKGGVDSEWWKIKRLSVSERSESGISSINSGSMKSSGSSSISSCSSSRSSSRRKSGGCWPFLLLKKNKRRIE